MHAWNIFSLTAIVISLSIFTYIELLPEDANAEIPQEVTTVEEVEITNPLVVTDQSKEASTSFLFVGDVMLGRYVEDLSLQHGFDYPYSNLKSILQKPDFTIGNFEGTVPSKHVPTEAYEMQFSFADEAFHHAALAGFDVFSLANNHADDYGMEGHQNTKNLCSLYELICAGVPTGVSKDNIAYLETDTDTIAIIFIDGTESLNLSSVKRTISIANNRADVVFVYIHWGDEYVLKNNTHQSNLAHLFVDEGVDLVVGHHPHVVQNIELYNSVPIIYSLGNFIFDQYFSADVLDGLMLGIELTRSEIELNFMGVTTEESIGSPKLMQENDEQLLFNRIFRDIADASNVDSKNGVIVIKRQ